MITHTVSARELAQNLSHAKRLAAEGPVFITDRGRPAFALLRIEDFHALSGQQREMSLLEMMQSMPDTQGIDYEPPRLTGELREPAY